MNQLKDDYTYSTTGVVYASPVNILSLPYNSVDNGAPVNIEVTCFGTSVAPDNTTVTRFCFVIPIIYFVNGSSSGSVPTKDTAVPYNSSAFSKMMHTDGIANFSALQVTPRLDTSTKTFSLELTVPNNSKSWSIYTYVKIIKPIV